MAWARMPFAFGRVSPSCRSLARGFRISGGVFAPLPTKGERPLGRKTPLVEALQHGNYETVHAAPSLIAHTHYSHPKCNKSGRARVCRLPSACFNLCLGWREFGKWRWWRDARCTTVVCICIRTGRSLSGRGMEGQLRPVFNVLLSPGRTLKSISRRAVNTPWRLSHFVSMCEMHS